MDELFEIDAQAREQALSQEDRQLLRLEKSKPLLDGLTRLKPDSGGEIMQLMRTAEETTEHRHDPIESALAGLKFVAAGGEQPYRAILSIVETRRRVASPVRAYLGSVLPATQNVRPVGHWPGSTCIAGSEMIECSLSMPCD